jgi:hypothetical protein
MPYFISYFWRVIKKKYVMTTVMIDNDSRIGRRLLKDIAWHPRIARIVENGMNVSMSPPDFSEQFRKNFDEDCRTALTPQQFMAEMEQRIRKW